MKPKKNQSNVFYKLEGIGRYPSVDGLALCKEFEVRGPVEDHVIVSVPDTMTQRSVTELLEGLSEEIKTSIIVVTHNIEFLRACKMDRKEVAKLIKQIGSDNDPMGRESKKIYGVN